MTLQLESPPKQDVFYPEDDGQPMSDNTLQWEWMVLIKEGLEILFHDDPNVFIAGNLLWYPVEGDNKTRAAPDAMAAFGRPKGFRGSYRQWEEDNIAPQVVFEVLSPGNRQVEMVRKFLFYQRFGVEEYYVYDPDACELSGWIRKGDELTPVEEVNGWVSPRLGVRFEIEPGKELGLRGPDGKLFCSAVELAEQARISENRRQEADLQRQEAEKEAARLAAKLRELGVDPDAR